MPIFPTPAYRAPLLLRGKHLETIVPNLTRRRFSARYRRERVNLVDGDFIDLDYYEQSAKGPNDACLLTLHGLEGSSSAPYVKSLFRAFATFPCDLVAMNLRGCSGEMNRAARFYHSGETGDLREVLRYLSEQYAEIFLLGFSLGGNVVLKYLGENPKEVLKAVKAGVAISAPIDLEGSALKIGHASNRIYMKRFVRLLSEKIEAKAEVYPELLDASGCRDILDFETFDGRYTAPLNGFDSARDYWRRSSAVNWLDLIETPALLLNARNDPFLSARCYPSEEEVSNRFLYTNYPDRGGHLGFPKNLWDGTAWHEWVVAKFFGECSLTFVVRNVR